MKRIRILSAACIAVILVGTGPVSLAQAPPSDASPPVRSSDPEAQVYVKFRPGAPSPVRAGLHAAGGHEVDRALNAVDIHVVRVPPGKSIEEVCARYEDHPLVEFCKPRPEYELQLTPNDPWFPNWQTNLQSIGAPEAWDITRGDPRVPVAIIDTGLDYEHYEFQPRVQAGSLSGIAFGVDDWYDTLGHGTLVTGVIGALADNGVGIAGAGWETPILAIHGFNGAGHQIDSVIYAADHGVRVISMSYAALYPTADLSALQYAYDRGVVLVASAGNRDSDTPAYPAAFDIVLAVTGVNADGLDCGYAYGDWIDLAAPCATMTTYPSHMDTTGRGISSVGGTSISAPFVAAAAALVLSVNPDLTPAQVMDILRTTADDIGEPGFDPKFGHGRVNYYKAVLAAQGAVPTVDTSPPTVELAMPAPGELMRGTADVLVTATDDTRVTQVDLYSDGVLVSGDTVPPHEWKLETSGLGDGIHVLEALAQDGVGNVGQSAPVEVLVDNTAPTVKITEPASGDVISGSLALKLEIADATAVGQVVHRVDGHEVGVDNAAPWDWTWDSTTVEDGDHDLAVTARDAAGNEATATVRITVENAVPEPVTRTFSGTVDWKNLAESFEVTAARPGLMQVEITFTGGKKSSFALSVIDSLGKVIHTREVQSSPEHIDIEVLEPETCRLRAEYRSGKVRFDLEVTLP